MSTYKVIATIHLCDTDKASSLIFGNVEVICRGDEWHMIEDSEEIPVCDGTIFSSFYQYGLWRKNDRTRG